MKSKKILFILGITFILILLGITKSEASLKLNELDFEAQINTDGSMDVTETWNIYISETNTLFKTFKIDNSKYSAITNVKVTEITSGFNKKFTEIYEEMYHVTKGCYYALNNSNGKFEIAWGVGLDNSSATKKYQISYTVKDAIAKYNDYSELYWQFVGDEFEINADKIKGKILLPYDAKNKEDIRVWGHTKYLNGEIYVTDLNRIEFIVNNYSNGNYVEVRTLIPNYMVELANREYDYNILESVIKEETKWAEEANSKRENAKMFFYISLVILGILVIYLMIKIIKYIKKLKSLEKKYKPSMELKYFRDLPYEDATPAEALFMMNDGEGLYFATSFSANILDLCLKKYITLELVEKNGKTNKDVVKINLLDKQIDNLKEDQALILKLLKEIAGEENELTTKDITKYLKKYPSKVNSLDEKMKKTVKAEKINKGKYVVEKHNEKSKYLTKSIIYVFMAISSVVFFPLLLSDTSLLRLLTSELIILLISELVILLVELITIPVILTKIASKINVFTQQGVDEKEQWKAFKKYMEEFSLLKDKEVPALVIWEKYLVFATAFGISEKVLKQLKVVYPEFTDINTTLYTYNYIHIMNSVNIGDCINSSVYSAVYSSGSGAGGGFSGGGGGGRWPEEVAADAKTESYFHLIKKYFKLMKYFFHIIR